MIGLRSCSIAFKEVFSNRKFKFYINQFLTVTQFIATIKPLLETNFGIREDEIEIVEAGQCVNGYLAEEASSLLPSSRKLYQVWGADLKNLAFYVRRKNYVYPQIENIRRQREEKQNNIRHIESISYVADCPICLETTTLARRYSCVHGICSQCYTRCQSSSITICSLCRSS